MKILLLLLPLVTLMIIPAYAEPVPDWFKTNALWWNEGLITDSDMMFALENLIATDVIKLDKFTNAAGIEHQSGATSEGTFLIPEYQKQVFGYWSDDLVTDDEIMGSIAYLIENRVIQSPRLNEHESFGVSFDDLVVDCAEFVDESSFTQVETDRTPSRFTGDSQIPDCFVTPEESYTEEENSTYDDDQPSQMGILFAGLFTGEHPLDFFSDSDNVNLLKILMESENQNSTSYTLDDWDDTLDDNSDLWNSNYYSVSISMPDGTSIVVINESLEESYTEEEWENIVLIEETFDAECDIPDLPCDYTITVELPVIGESAYPGLEDEDIVVEYTEETVVEDTSDDLSDLPGLDYDEVIWTTSVHFIDGEPYPMFQFMILARSSDDTTCPNGTFAPISQSYNTIYHLNFDEDGLVYDESANNDCGNFGEWTSDASDEYYPITEAQGEFMREQFNFDFVFESYLP